MSSTGTRKPRDVQSRANDAIIENDKELINSFKVFAESSNATAGLAGPSINNSPKTPAGNYLAREGDSMIGPLALGPPLNFRIEVDGNNTIDIGPLSENVQFSSNIQLDDFQPNSSVLDIIANAAFDGQILILRTFAPTVPYTISQGTLPNGGNIQTLDSNDISLGDLAMIILVFDESLIINANTGGTWRVLTTSGPSGVTSTFVSADLTVDQTTNLTTGNHVEFDRNATPTGANGGIFLQTGVGQANGIFELKANKTYFLTAAIDVLVSGSRMVEFVWFDITNGTELGRRSFVDGTASTTNQPKCEIIFTPSTNVNVEVRIIAQSGGGGFTSILSAFSFASIFEFLGVIQNGTTGINEPIELGFNEVTTETPPTKTIVSGDIFNPSHIVLDQDIEIQLDLSATVNKYKSIFVIFDTTGGNFTVTWPASVVNPPIIDDSIAQRISVILYTIDNGILFTHATSVGSSTGAAEFFGPWTAAHDSSNQNLIGLNTLGFFQAGQSIQTKPDPDGGLLYNVSNLQSHIFRANLDEIARFEESASGVFRLDMLDHSIVRAQDIRFDESSGAIVFPSNIPAIGFDSTTDRFIINMPTGANLFVTNNNVIGSTQITNNSIDANVINASDVLQLGVDVTVPSFVGEFRNDGTDVTIFSGGAVRNISNIGAGSPLTTKGDIFGFDTADARILVGTNGQVLTANSAIGVGVEWQDVVVQNSISQQDSNITVTDSGSNGLIQFTLDSVLVAQMQNNRMDFQDTRLFGIISLFFTDTVDVAVGTTLTQNQNDFTMNFPANTDDFIINFNSVPGFIVDKDFTRVASTSPNTVEAVFELFRDDPSPLAGDEVGIFKFRGKNSNNLITTYAQVESQIIDPLSTNETSRLRWSIFDSNIFVNSMILSPGNLTLREFKTAPTATDKAIFHLLKEDASPAANDSIGSVDFDLLDSGVTTNYAQILGKVGDATDFGILELRVRADNVSLTTGLTLTGDDNVTNRSYLTVGARIDSDLNFGFDGVGSLDAKIHPLSASTTLQIVVQDNVSFTNGSEGMLANPVVPSLVPTLASLDAAFGDHVGACGVLNTSSATVNIAWKSRSDEWVLIAIPSGGGNVTGEHFN